ncbi:MAG: NAD(P)/FAD-dependent oxidoreductase [Chloroflexaceae bacterium]|nr:NAD(P)/FAD-dependent oxidoreductase [Chloroflexaceae bacterium]
MKIAIIGAGIAGLAAAYDLARAGHAVTVYEAAPEAGGLASGFRDERWEWPLERFYHHLFETDTAIRGLVAQIGYQDQLFFRQPVTAQWWQGRLYPIDGPSNVLRFPAIPPLERLRFGLVVAFLKFVYNDWQRLEGHTAAEWSLRWMGPGSYRSIIRPLLEGKFGPYAYDVNMAWLWARFRARSFKLGYFVGGFQGFVDALVAAVEQHGVSVRLQTPVHQLQAQQTGWHLQSPAGEQHYDRIIATGSPRLLARLAPQLPETYLDRLLQLRSLGAVVLVLALKHQLTPHFYWMQGMDKRTFPFLALVEHTNFIEPSHYGGDHLIYCGDYLPADHPAFQMSMEQLVEQFIAVLPQFNPHFQADWIRATWLHRVPYAQPIVGLNHSQAIPPLATPLPGLYWASMSQVYPWDRGTNFAVELGQRVAAEVLASHR